MWKGRNFQSLEGVLGGRVLGPRRLAPPWGVAAGAREGEACACPPGGAGAAQEAGVPWCPRREAV